ncbi:Uncharacterized protein Fot_22173 [Forsythia ovata]|uniref:Replication protein A 70 kDa DNA-binding subunit B/D first OB fold domain-containing protein n=1 Tax=Forsythia ovata TaxID=205694 RepID=A0ABD1UWY6_9LAMI
MAIHEMLTIGSGFSWNDIWKYVDCEKNVFDQWTLITSNPSCKSILHQNMAEQCHFISEVDSTKTQWRLKVRVVRVWEVPCFDNKAETNSLEMVFADSQFQSPKSSPPPFSPKHTVRFVLSLAIFKVVWDCRGGIFVLESLN